MAWPHSITQVLTYGSERSSGWIPPPRAPSTAKWCHKSRENPAVPGMPFRVSWGYFWAWFGIASATPTQPAPVISILQARDSSTEMQHTHNTTQHTFSTTWNNLDIIFLFSSKKKKNPQQKTNFKWSQKHFDCREHSQDEASGFFVLFFFSYFIKNNSKVIFEIIKRLKP